ncbi:MAG: hypothetical protein KDA87_07600 [Planctomycetales bacterium]|nr:hypothetical protein [Planctomycetales bacterium]
MLDRDADQTAKASQSPGRLARPFVARPVFLLVTSLALVAWILALVALICVENG